MPNLDDLLSGKLQGEKHLKLSCKLRTFPEEIYTLADSLEFLDLSQNELSELPKDFWRLKNLKILFLSENKFTEFPKVLGKCVNLDIIGFKSNSISRIDEDSFPLNLRWLILTNNQLTQIPKTIGKCIRLQKLMLAGNKITNLPDEMSNCINLQLLRLSANNIQTLPEWLFKLPKLAWLAFSGNSFLTEIESGKNLDEIFWEKIILKEKIGEGASGLIFKSEISDSGIKDVAVKLFKGEVTSDGFPSDEMLVLSKIGFHNNIVKVIGMVINHPEDKKCLAFELIPDTFKNLGNPPSLESCTRDIFQNELSFSLLEILQILVSISSAMVHLHSLKIMHGDLYAHNILLDREKSFALLGDFGAATIYENIQMHSNLIERIDIRAFGRLVEDLLSLVQQDERNTDKIEELETLMNECILVNSKDMIDFNSIHKKLKFLIS